MNTIEKAPLPRYSIIIPTCNAASCLLKTIESVQQQTITEWEIILVDDGSTDNTLEILTALRESRMHILSQPNAGPAAARVAKVVLDLAIPPAEKCSITPENQRRNHVPPGPKPASFTPKSLIPRR